MTSKILSFVFLFLALTLSAQVPQTINYQGIARLSSGVVANQALSVKIEILNNANTSIFSETHTPTTNAYGVFNIGVGTVNPTGFKNINWLTAKKIRSTFSYSGQNMATTDDLKSTPFAQLTQRAVYADTAYYVKYADFANKGIFNFGPDAAYYISGSGHLFLGKTEFNATINISGGGEQLGIDPRRYGYLDGAGGTGTRTDVSGYYSIIAGDRIWAQEFNASSDERIKANITQSNTANDVNSLKNLTVRDFKYKDKVQNSNEFKKGFIAQEVERVFPEAVNKTVNFIPNIYQIAKNIKINDEAQTLTLSVDSLDELKIGDKIRLISKSKYELEVTAVEGTSFTVKGWTEKDTKNVFVYGKQVNDFRVVDYDRIFTLNVSVTQALIQEVDALKAQVQDLKAHNQVLEKSNVDGLKRMEKMENRLIQLEEATAKVGKTDVKNVEKTNPKR